MKKIRVPEIKRRWRAIRAHYKDTPHRSFRMTPLTKRRYSLQGVREGWQLVFDTFVLMREHKKTLVGMGLLYAFISYFLIGGISQASFVAIKQGATETFGDILNATGTAVSLYGAALTGNLQEEPGEGQQIMGALLVIIFWLAIIWALRMLAAGNKIKLRDAFYNGMTPMVSTILVLVVFTAQLLPAIAGVFVYSVANTDGWLQGGVEAMVFAAAAGLAVLLSLFWASGTIVAMAIVALPGMYPMQALASARKLVSGRRWSVVMRLLVMLVIALLVWAIVLIPIFLLDGWLRFDWLPLVPIFVQALSALTLVFGVTYVYRLYRSLL